MTSIEVADEAALRRITINRPGKRNALDVETAAALAEAVETAVLPRRAVLITGAAPSFCVGGDLPSLAAVAERGSLAATQAIYSAFHGIVRAIRRSPLPVIAAVNGAALGAGLDLALCCDLRVAGEDAVFESAWIKAGLIPGMAGARLLPQVIGAGPAARMLLLGGRVDAQQALALGLVDAVAQDPVAAAEEMAGTIASLSYDAVSRTKAALRRGLDQGLDAELDVLGAQQGQLLDGDEFRAFASRFISKSRPSEGR